MFFRSDESDHPTSCDQNYIEHILLHISANESQKKKYDVPQTFIFDVGTSASAARLRKFASNLRQSNDDVLIAISNSKRPISEVRKVSAPMREGVSRDSPKNVYDIPLSMRLRSKFVRRSNMRRSWETVTILRICRWRYSR